MAKLTKRDEATQTFVPKHEAHAAKAFKQCETAADGEKLGMILQDLLEAVIGNPATEMMDMVDANVRREPAQNSRQVVMRASTKRCLVKIPFPAMRPERLFKLVLHIK